MVRQSPHPTIHHLLPGVKIGKIHLLYTIYHVKMKYGRKVWLFRFNYTGSGGSRVEKNKKFTMSMTTPLHKELKVKAAQSGKTMHQFIEEMIEKSLEAQGYGSKLRRRTGT